MGMCNMTTLCQLETASAGGNAQPELTLTLGTVDNTKQRPSYIPLCNGSSADVSPLPDADGYDIIKTRNRALFQNEALRSCIPYLDQVTSFRIQSTGATSRVSFCMDDIQLLPSTLQPAGRMQHASLVLLHAWVGNIRLYMAV